MNKYDRIYELEGGAKDYWSKKGIEVCYTCRKPLETGKWVLVTRGVNPKVRHLKCALKVHACYLSDLPEAAARTLTSRDAVRNSAKQYART